MTGGQLATLLRRMRRAAGAGQPGGLGDADLLRRFVADRDEAAFEVLLWRHGAMVLNVCRRVLGHEQDAEDAFQATFLALARKAGSVARQSSVGGWLYRVAYRAALAARQRRNRDAARRSLAADVPVPVTEPEWLWRELRPVLDEEVSRLPERQRLAFVLCCLEGKTNAEAARELGLPEGTVASRLSGARRRLRARLTRRGLALPAGALAAVLTARAASAAVAPAPAAATVRAAVWFVGSKGTGPAAASTAITLTKGVLRAMWMTNLKLAAAMFLAAGILGTGAGALAFRLGAAEPPAAQAEGTPASSPAPPERPAKAADVSPKKVAAPGRQAAGEQAERLAVAEKRAARLEDDLRKREADRAEERKELRGRLVGLEERLRSIERRQATQRERERARARPIEQRINETTDQLLLNGSNPLRLRAELDKLEAAESQREEQRTKELISAREELLTAEDDLRQAERRQEWERARMQAALEAADEQVRRLQEPDSFPETRDAELNRKLDRLLRELDALRHELRQRGTDRGDRPE